MAAEILDGKVMSEKLRAEIAERVTALKEKGITPGLAVILVGNDPASEIYVRNKGKGCKEVGMYSRTIRLPAFPEAPMTAIFIVDLLLMSTGRPGRLARYGRPVLVVCPAVQDR